MKIKEITLLSADLTGTYRFYSDVMAFETVRKTDAELTFLAGSSLLTFTKSDKNCVYHFAFDIPHNLLEQARSWISKKLPLIEFEGSEIIDFPNWNAKSLYFYDNNGNVLEFIARFDNESTLAGPFSGNIVSISEIALVTDNVENLGSRLISEFGLEYYHRQEQREDFSVLGNDDGLIILVDSSRKWFPTPVPVERFPVTARVESNGEVFTISYGAEF